MTEQLPDPPIPADVDLRGLEYMPLLGGKLFESDFYLDSNDAEFRIGLRLWWASWNQVPAGSLPAEDHRIRGLAGLAENPEKWRKVRDKALRGFTKHADGRLYHAVIVEQALIAWEKRVDVREVQGNRQSRKERMNADRKAMFAALREIGVRPGWDIGMRELRQLHAEHCAPGTPPGTKPGTPTVPGPEEPGTPPGTLPGTPRTVPGTARTVRDGTVIPGTGDAVPPPPPAGAREDGPEDPDPPDDDAPPAPTPAGRIGWAMRRAGVPPAQCNPSDPTALALLQRGATIEQFEDTAREAVTKGIRRPWPWVLATLAGRLDEAAQVAAGPAVGPDPMAWRKSLDGVQRRAGELGLSPRPGEMAHDFERRVLTAHQRAAGRQGAAA